MSIKEVPTMEKMTIRLKSVKDTYYGFVAAVLTYVKKKPSRQKKVEAFMANHPEALTADILDFISSQDDFLDDAAYDHAEVS